MLVENKNYEIEIVDIGHKGEAIGKIDGFPVFIDGAVTSGGVCSVTRTAEGAVR